MPADGFDGAAITGHTVGAAAALEGRPGGAGRGDQAPLVGCLFILVARGLLAGTP